MFVHRDLVLIPSQKSNPFFFPENSQGKARTPLGAGREGGACGWRQVRVLGLLQTSQTCTLERSVMLESNCGLPYLG